MSIKVHLDASLQRYAKGNNEIEINADTVEECLNKVAAHFPELKPALFSSQGTIWNDLTIFLNNTLVAHNQIIENGSELYIIVPVEGG